MKTVKYKFEKKGSVGCLTVLTVLLLIAIAITALFKFGFLILSWVFSLGIIPLFFLVAAIILGLILLEVFTS